MRVKHMTLEEHINNLTCNRPELIFLEKPKYVKDTFKVLCTVSGEVFYPSIDSLRLGRCCKFCGINKVSKIRRDKAEMKFRKELKDKLPHIVITGEYTRKKDYISFYCETHSEHFITSPDTMLRRLGCEKCRKDYLSNKMSYSQMEYRDMFDESVKNILLVGEYKGARNKVELSCCMCGHEWEANAYYVLKGVGCPQCNESKGEKIIRNILKEHNIEYVREFTPSWCGGKRYRYDFYLPKYNMLIEFDGKQHFEEFSGHAFKSTSTLADRSENDYIKDTLCIHNEVKLLRISFSEMDVLQYNLVPLIKELYNSSDIILRSGKEYNITKEV